MNSIFEWKLLQLFVISFFKNSIFPHAVAMNSDAACYAASSKFHMDKRLMVILLASTSDSSFAWAQRRNIITEIVVEQMLQNEEFFSDGDPPEGRRFNHDR